MKREKETAQRGNAGGKVNHQQGQPTMRAARGASPGRWRFGMSVGEAIVIALAMGAAARMGGDK
jgi:hypothetical protein